MNKRVLALSFFLLTNVSTFAIDINESETIIKEATKATEGLQNEFSKLINEPDESNSTTKLNKDKNSTSKVIANEVIIVSEINSTEE